MSEIDHPTHYNSHPSGIECIDVAETLNFCLGNALKYLMRAGLKDSSTRKTDLEKAKWYIQRNKKNGVAPFTSSDANMKVAVILMYEQPFSILARFMLALMSTTPAEFEAQMGWVLHAIDVELGLVTVVQFPSTSGGTDFD